MKRRHFLLTAGLTAASPLLLPLLCRSQEKGGAKGGAAGRVVVLLDLKGGNDGLNTVIPYRDPAYRRARPTLAINDGPLLDDDLMLHPALAPLVPAWQGKRLGFALGVGWPRPNRSHFKAQDQWATGSESGEGSGWFAADLARQKRERSLVSLGPAGTPALEGPDVISVQMVPEYRRKPGSGRSPFAALDPDRAGDNVILRSILELEASGAAEVARLMAALGDLPRDLAIPPGSLGPQVAMALRLIGASSPPAVIGLELPGFDTHNQQRPQHARRLTQLGEALACFDQGLSRLKQRPEVMLVAVSEFGRRLEQNGSGGTDHGSASVAILLGDGVPPFFGEYPSLTDLDERGDLKPSLLPTQLYESVVPA